MPQYAVSTFGRWYVSDEEISELPMVRKIFVIITALFGILTLVHISLILRSTKRSILKSTNLFKSAAGRTILCYIISHIIHSVHFVDNIFRPVDYFEPKWLYDKYLISEMEITFFVNFPIVLIGLYFMKKIINGIENEKYIEITFATRKMSLYILGSLLTVGHYRTEPPWMYQGFRNFTIAGEGVATIILAILLYNLNKESKLKNSRISAADAELSVGLLKESNNKVRARTPVKK